MTCRANGTPQLGRPQLVTTDQATVGAFLVGALALGGAFVRWVWPLISDFFKALATTFETINGKPAVVDRAGRVQEPAEPSLRVQLADIKATVSDQAAQNEQITALTKTQAEHARILAEHGERFARLEDGSLYERLMARHESTSAFNAMEAIANHPDEGQPS